MQRTSEGASPAKQLCALEAASSPSEKEQLGMVSLSPTPEPSFAPLLGQFGPGAAAGGSPADSASHGGPFPQGTSLLCRTCLRCVLCTSPKSTLARHLRWGGRVLNPGSSPAGSPLGREVLWAEGQHTPGSLGWWLQCLGQGEYLIPRLFPKDCFCV